MAEEASFTRAAARVHVAQPGVSAQIRRLERELGQELLDRSGRGVRLTAAGAAVLPYARAALRAVTGARLAVDELTGLVRGHVAVGVAPSCPPLDLPALLAEFRRDHPAVEITLSESGSGDLLEGLLAGTLDMALVWLRAAPPPTIEVQVAVDEELVVAVGHDDPLATETTVTLEAIRKRALVGLPKGADLRCLVDEAYAAAGLRPRIAFETGDPRVLAELTGQGLGVAIVPASLAEAHAASLRAITLASPRPRRRIALAWRAEGPGSPAARALVTHARATLPRL